MVTKPWLLLILLLSAPVAYGQIPAARVAEVSAEVWLNAQGCAWAQRNVIGGEAAPEVDFYDYEYDAFDGSAFVLASLDAPVRMGLTWSERQVTWEVSVQGRRQLKVEHGLHAWMEEHEIIRQPVESAQSDELLEDSIRFFEVMEEWDGGGHPIRPDPRFRHLAARVDGALDRWNWPGKAMVMAYLADRITSWAPAAFRRVREFQGQFYFVDATPAWLTLVRKVVRDQNGAWGSTCRLRAEPRGVLGVRTLDDFTGEYLRFLAMYGFGPDLLTDDDPDPLPYTAAWLAFGRPLDATDVAFRAGVTGQRLGAMQHPL